MAWTSANIDGTTQLHSVSCVSASFCVAGDHNGSVLVFNGATWSSPQQIDGPGTIPILSISCVSATFCVAGDGSGNVMIYNGSSWSTPLTLDPAVAGSVNGVSCTSTTFCTAVDSSGNAYTYNGSSWSAPVVVDSSAFLDGVSCTSPSFCVATDRNFGAVYIYTGSWSAANNIDAHANPSLNAVSCATPSFCVAVDPYGNALTYNGSTWSSALVDPGLSGALGITAVSCLSSTFCAAVDADGNAVVYSELHGAGPAPANGDIYISGTAGTIERRNPNGALAQVLYIGTNDPIAGMAFDSSGTLYVTDFIPSGGAANIFNFNATGTPSPFSSFPVTSLISNADSLAFSTSGDPFVGVSFDGGAALVELNTGGSIAATIVNPTNDNSNLTSVPFVDLAIDQCTVFYTVKSQTVFRNNACTGANLTPFATGLPGTSANELRILPNNQVLVADGDRVVLLDTTGAFIQSYAVGLTTNNLVALSLDPDGSTFWVGDSGGNVYRFNIQPASNTPVSQFSTNFTNSAGNPTSSAINGLEVIGEVRDAMVPPPSCTVTASPSKGPSPLTVNFTANCTSLTGTVSNYTLDFGDGSPALQSSNPGPVQTPHVYNPTFTNPSNPSFNTVDTFSVRLTGTDINGTSGFAPQQVVTVNNPVSCTLTATPLTGSAPLTVNATGSCTSTSAITYVLSFQGGNSFTSNTGTNTFAQPGQFQVTLTGTDANNNSSSAIQTVIVNSPVSCTFNVQPNGGFAPLLVTANGNCTSSTGTINNANDVIDWGDGTSNTENSGTHTYTGSSNATISATDSNGNTGSATQLVLVQTAGGASCTLSISPDNGPTLLAVTANLTCTPPTGGTFLSGSLAWGDGANTTVPSNPNPFTATHTYLRAGTYTALAQVSFSLVTGGTTSTAAEQNVFVTTGSATPVVGDVFISTVSGVVEEHSASGALAQVFDTGTQDELGQMAFDSSRNLYVVDFNSGDGTPNAFRFDPSGNLSFFTQAFTEVFGTNSFAFDSAGNAYIGSNVGDGGNGFTQFNFNGQILNTFLTATDPADDANGFAEPDYVDIAADQCTGYYTSFGTQIKAFNFCTNQQLPDFADNVGTPVPIDGSPTSFAGELRIRPNGEVLVADNDFVVRFNSTGSAIQTYSTPSGGNTFIGLSLDPDEITFWTSQATGEVDHFDIASGALLSTFQTSFNLIAPSGKPRSGAVSVLGEIRAAYNQGPTCTVGVTPASGFNPLTATITGTCTDPTASIVSTTLDLGDGTTLNTPSGTHTYLTPGTYTITLSATDAKGPHTSVTTTITVNPNLVPTCTLSVTPTSGFEPLAVTATGNCTDTDGDALVTSLNFGDGTIVPGSNGTHTYTTSGTLIVTLTATDAANNVGTATQTVTVNANLPPTCTLSLSPTSGTAPLPVTATGNCTDPDGDTIVTSLNFGDGTTQVPPSGTHTYLTAGTFTVTLTATDPVNNSVSVTKTVTVSAGTFPTGVFVGLSGGTIKQFASNGTVLKTLSTGVSGTLADMAFDKAGNLYTVNFTAGSITEMNLTTGAVIGPFGSGYNCQPESMVFDGAGNVYVGQQGCSLALLKFDPTGKLLATYNVATEEQGSDDLALSADNCTMLYTSEGQSILRYDVCHNQQLAPFATGLNKALNLKILSDGGVLVADLADIVRFNAAGTRTTTYTVPGAQCLYGVALDQDGKTFWTDDFCSSTIFHIDLTSGSVLSQFGTGTGPDTVFGLAIAGSGLNVAGLGNAGTLTASPQSASLSAGQSATFTVSLTPNAAAAGLTITLSCAGLPPGLSCSFNPPTLTLGAAGTTSTAQMTISRTNTAALMHPASPSALATWLAVVPAMVLAGLRSPRRRRGTLLWLGLIVVGTGLWASCGGGGTSMSQSTGQQTTPAGTFTVIVVGTSGGMQASTTVNITAN